MKRKQGTFSQEISEVLGYYRAVAERSNVQRIQDPHARKLSSGPRLRAVSSKSAVSRTR
jgi:hypothetical protein